MQLGCQADHYVPFNVKVKKSFTSIYPHVFMPVWLNVGTVLPYLNLTLQIRFQTELIR
jgi:hypothetical protein